MGKTREKRGQELSNKEKGNYYEFRGRLPSPAQASRLRQGGTPPWGGKMMSKEGDVVMSIYDNRKPDDTQPYCATGEGYFFDATTREVPASISLKD